MNPDLADSQRFKPWVYRHPQTFLQNWRKGRTFKKCIGELPLTERFSRPENIPWSRFHHVVFGSDVIWDFESPAFGRDATFAGTYGPSPERAVAYAPSIGTMPKQATAAPAIRASLSAFKHLSARDANTAEWVQSLLTTREDKSVPVVVDPTWLAESPMDGKPCPGIDLRSILVYATKVSDEQRRDLVQFARSNQLKLVATGYPHRWCDEVRLEISPFEWVGAIRQAALIVAGTFHGTLYAIRENKPFVVLTNPNMADKTGYWLERLGLQNRIWKAACPAGKLFTESIDYASVRAEIAKAAQFSRDYLRAALDL